MEKALRSRRLRIQWRGLAGRLWRGWVKPILMVVLVLGSFKSSVADWYDVPTGSMKPTILEGDRIAVNKVAYDLKVPFFGWQLAQWGGPDRGDVVVCHSPEDGVRLVKRVIGLPGDRIEMRDNRLVINGQAVVYDPLLSDASAQFDANDRFDHQFAFEHLGPRPHPLMITPAIQARRFIAPVVVPEGNYLVLGDNRDQSKDSRYFGFIPRDRITGRAFGVAFSLDRDRWYVPRWNRFLRGMD